LSNQLKTASLQNAMLCKMQCSNHCKQHKTKNRPTTVKQFGFPAEGSNNLASIFSGVVWQSMFEPVLLKHNKKDGIF
jgi:hypothetical protein